MKIKGVLENLKIKTIINLKNENSKNMYISRTFSGVFVNSVGSVHFQIVPSSSLYFSRSVVSSLSSQC